MRRTTKESRCVFSLVSRRTLSSSCFALLYIALYRASRPPLYDDALDFLASSLFGDQERNRRVMLEKIIYAKILDWDHESEYRLAIPLRQGEDWNTLPYHPEEITELYLGLAMTTENEEEIIGKANASKHCDFPDHS
jgi:hypothetical protein